MNSATNITIPIKGLFHRKEAGEIYGTSISATIENEVSGSADITIIISSHNYPELSNATIKNYLSSQKHLKLHIIVVESSGSKTVFQRLISHLQVTKVLLSENLALSDKIHGYGSYGMALSSAIGSYLSSSPYIFYSHSDMLTLIPDFLKHPLETLNSTNLIFSFTQRHLIPFTGCMLATAKLMKQSDFDWLPTNDNPYHSKWLSLIHNSELQEPHLSAVDCGEAYIYGSLAQKKSMTICASRGGSQNYWKHPLSYFNLQVSQLTGLLNQSKQIIYQDSPISKQEFESKYDWVLSASDQHWWDRDKRKYWRYSFNQAGELVFIHHGRGTTKRKVKRWLHFADQVNQKMNKS